MACLELTTVGKYITYKIKNIRFKYQYNYYFVLEKLFF